MNYQRKDKWKVDFFIQVKKNTFLVVVSTMAQNQLSHTLLV